MAGGNSDEENRGADIALNTGVAIDNTVYQYGRDSIASSGESTIRSNSITRNRLVTIGHGIDRAGRCNAIVACP